MPTTPAKSSAATMSTARFRFFRLGTTAPLLGGFLVGLLLSELADYLVLSNAPTWALLALCQKL